MKPKKKKKWVIPTIDRFELKDTSTKSEQIGGFGEGKKNPGPYTIGS
tara:strand:+ start:1081 stop:1221 length:141 start_codon:yes stop_codon:yes gene_type:complete